MTVEEDIAKIRENQIQILSDMAVIKNNLVGNGREGLLKKVEKHDKYFYMIAGGWGLIGIAWIIFNKIW